MEWSGAQLGAGASTAQPGSSLGPAVLLISPLSRASEEGILQSGQSAQSASSHHRSGLKQSSLGQLSIYLVTWSPMYHHNSAVVSDRYLPLRLNC